ncbi:hypothetical protein ACTQ6A_15770 [Lachnospiraceae bacterium LCP25S3_G4]
MTMMPMWKTCPKYHKRYSWNPDLGQMRCPKYLGLGKTGKSFFDKIYGKKNNADSIPDEISVTSENTILNKDATLKTINIKIDK